MSFLNKVFGRALASWEETKEELNVIVGIPVLGLDAIASTGYGPEAALTVLMPLGAEGLRYLPGILLAVLIQLIALFLSYRQTAEAYPNGGGAYIVAKENLGPRFALPAAVALLVDYLLNVAVAIAAGVGSIVSVFPMLHPFVLPLCLFVLFSLMILNLRGIRESGLMFVLPVGLFLLCMTIVFGWGLVQLWQSGGHPIPQMKLPPLPASQGAVSAAILLGGFANGCTAMTGVEAVSNGVPLFREPKVKNAHRTLTAIVVILACFLAGIAILCPAFQIGAMNERDPGYQSILSQLVQAVAGRGAFYSVTLTAIFVVLTYSAQTSFTDFPRVCRLLAEDNYLPAAFANRGRRLVYSHGIVFLTIASAFLLIAFQGITDLLIPLFAIGALGAFLFSQVGMVKHWHRMRGKRFRLKLFFNLSGAVFTSVALVVILIAKFREGAWITLLAIPILWSVLLRIRHHSDRITKEVGSGSERELSLDTRSLKKPVVVVPIGAWDRVAEKAMRFALLLSDEVHGVHIHLENEDPSRLREIWKETVETPAILDGSRGLPKLHVIPSPYRLVYEPLLDFVERIKRESPDRFVAVVIPRLVEPHWYQSILHNQYGRGLLARLFQKRDDRTIIIDLPWYFETDETRDTPLDKKPKGGNREKALRSPMLAKKDAPPSPTVRIRR